MKTMAVKLKAKQRADLSKSATKQLRNEGSIPSVVYGKGKDTLTVSVDSIELFKVVRDEGRNAILTLDLEDGEAVDVMLHEYQVDPIKQNVIHADFYIVDMDQEMDVTVSINLDGEPVGAKEGGVLQQPLYELSIRAKPSNIPDEISIDVSELNIGDCIAVSDLKDEEAYTITEDADTTIVSVTASIPEEELETTAEEEDAEPELDDQKGEQEEEEEDVE